MMSTKSSNCKGTLLVIVGPSGSGKDTLLSWLQTKLPTDQNILFARRTITRPQSPETEQYDSMTPSEFAMAEHEGAFCAVWQAHGLHYGIDSAVQHHVALGGLAILNGSRRALPDLSRIFPTMYVVQVSAERDVLKDRLLARGRESISDIEKRLDGMSTGVPPQYNPLIVDNSGSIKRAGEKILQLVRELAKDNLEIEAS